MSKTEIIGYAKSDTPEDVHIPPTWAGVGAWLLGRYGVGALFMGMVFFLYQDLKAANERYSAISETTARTLQTLIGRIDESCGRVDEMRETIRRIEAAANNHKP